MKRCIHQFWFQCILVVLVILAGTACIQWILYPVGAEKTDQYVEEKYGAICDRMERKGSILYICKTREETYLVALKESLWLSGQYREEEATTTYRLTMHKGNYEFFTAYNYGEKLELDAVSDIEKEMRVKKIIYIIVFCFAACIAWRNQRARHRKHRPKL